MSNSVALTDRINPAILSFSILEDSSQPYSRASRSKKNGGKFWLVLGNQLSHIFPPA